ncbi:4Fe-4S dicluster domain-containing protein, partial [Bacteroidota bacterium]
LMTPKSGPRTRISVVTTDIPLLIDEPVSDHTIIDFCKKCVKCAEVCPSQAIPTDFEEKDGKIKRWQINQEACYTFWCKAGTDCGRCLAVCPYSHPDNFMHNFVRWGIRNSYLFRQIAVKLDNFLYVWYCSNSKRNRRYGN